MIFNENEINEELLEEVREEILELGDEEKICCEHLEKFFFARFPHPIFKEQNIGEKEAMTSKVHFWDEKHWPEIKSQELRGFLHRILKDDLGITATCRKNDLIAGFLSKYIISEEEINVDGKRLFNTMSGVICLDSFKKTMQGLGSDISIQKMLSMRNLWLFKHEQFKQNHLTCLANIEIPENISLERYKSDLDFFKKTFLKSMGYREDSLEWLFNLFSACISGERKGDHFTALYGAPATGKTTLTKFLRLVFGNYLQTIEPEDFVQKSDGGVRKFYHARFARMINLSELPERKANSSFIKKITGNSEILIGNYGETFTLDAHILIDTNHLLTPDETDSTAFLRRVIYIPFGPQIEENAMDKDLLQKLAKVKESFFLNLLLRFPNVNPTKISTPTISKEVIKTSEKFRNPIDFFFQKWCVPALDVHGGRKYKLSEIYRIFIQEFFYDYESEFNTLFYHSEDFHRKPASIAKQKFNLKFQDVHHFVRTGHGGDLIFYNLIIHNPGNYTTMREYQKKQLREFYRIATSDEEAEILIKDAERPSVISVPNDAFETEYRDILWYKGFPSFYSLGIPQNKIVWENSVLMLLLSGGGVQVFSWLQKTMDQTECNQIWAELMQRIQNYNYNFAFCCNDCGIRGILSSLFDFFVNSVRKIRKNMPSHHAGQEEKSILIKPLPSKQSFQ